MAVSGVLHRWTCDRCRQTVLNGERAKPSGWLQLEIQSRSRLGQIRDLCDGCAKELDRFLFHRFTTVEVED